jgi:hypothetical protein
VASGACCTGSAREDATLLLRVSKFCAICKRSAVITVSIIIYIFPNEILIEKLSLPPNLAFNSTIGNYNYPLKTPNLILTTGFS